MFFKLVSLTFFIYWNLKIIKSQSITIRTKSIICEHVNPEIYNGNVTCFVKPARNGNDITNIRYTFREPANDLWVHGKVFFKYYSSTTFQPWVIEFDEDICLAAKNIDKFNGFLKYLVNAVLKNSPGLLHTCPYFGDEGLKDGNLNKIMGDAVPQVVPRGTYKLLLRMHTKSNETIANVWVTIEVSTKKVFDMG